MERRPTLAELAAAGVDWPLSFLPRTVIGHRRDGRPIYAQAGGTAPTAQQAPAPGQWFDIPGVPGGSSQWFEQDESSNNVVATLSASSQAPIQGIVHFTQTDVVLDWYLTFTVAQTYTAGTGQTLTASAYAPYNQIGPVKLSIQNQYASVNVESGIDMAIFDIIRPYNQSEVLTGVNNYNNPAGDPIGGTATGYFTTALAQPNNINAAQWATNTASYNLVLRLPAGCWFDEYYNLAITGEPVGPAGPAFVSPQYMAGTTRIITPVIQTNPMFGVTTDLAPVYTTTLTGGGDTASSASGTGTLRLRRRGIYAGNPQVQPPDWPWQYQRATQRYGLSGVSRINIPLPLDAGQIMAVYVRLFDPSAASGVGAPIALSQLTQATLIYGSGLQRFDAQSIAGGISAAAMLQRQWLEGHNQMLPAGVFCWDLARTERHKVTNRRCLNTLTTAGIKIFLSFASTLSSTAYAVVGIESLVYVT